MGPVITEKRFLGKPCIHGHSGVRYKVNGRCVECGKISAAKWLKENPEKNVDYVKKSQKLHPEKHRFHVAKWSKSNPTKERSKWAKRRAAKLNAIPKWISPDQKSAIEAIYACAKLMNMEVDHIHPLQGKNFCGLHVPWNLQILSAFENAKKANKPPPDEAGMFFDPPIGQQPAPDRPSCRGACCR